MRTPPQFGKDKKGPPAMRQHVLEVMVKLYGWRTFVEIGVRKGNTGLHLLRTCPGLNWCGIDPYDRFLEEGKSSDEGWYDFRGDPMEKRYKYIKHHLKPFGDRATLIRKTSAEAVGFFDDKSVDCVFVDGDHRYEFVKEDIINWRPKVAPGGWLTGHDIDWPSTKRAVDECVDGYIVLPDVMWAVQC
jgi:predicted O-methyltransferase YrrM